jgi:hypothetical protein
MMKKWLLIIGACLVFGCSLLAHLPARLVFPEQVGRFQFLGIGGTLWHGEVEQVRFSGKALPVRNVNWTVKPIALFTGTLRADFFEQQMPANKGTAGLKLLSRQIELHALHWQLSPGSLDPWFRTGVSLQGDFVLNVQTLRLAPGRLFPSQLDGQLEWDNAALQFDAQYWDIGSPVVRLAVEGDAIKGNLTNSQPMLPGDSSFQCTMESCRVDLRLQPTPDAPQSLLNGLSLIGLQRTGDTFSGQITLPIE